MIPGARRWPASVGLLGLALAMTGCGGDAPGFSVLVDNRSSVDVVIFVDGTGSAAESTTFRSVAGSSGWSGFVRLDSSDAGVIPGRIIILSDDCRPRSEYSAEAGAFVVTVDDAGTTLADHDGRPDSVAATLPSAPPCALSD
jgi:hypothetical protein